MVTRLRLKGGLVPDNDGHARSRGHRGTRPRELPRGGPDVATRVRRGGSVEHDLGCPVGDGRDVPGGRRAVRLGRGLSGSRRRELSSAGPPVVEPPEVEPSVVVESPVVEPPVVEPPVVEPPEVDPPEVELPPPEPPPSTPNPPPSSPPVSPPSSTTSSEGPMVGTSEAETASEGSSDGSSIASVSDASGVGSWPPSAPPVDQGKRPESAPAAPPTNSRAAVAAATRAMRLDVPVAGSGMDSSSRNQSFSA